MLRWLRSVTVRLSFAGLTLLLGLFVPVHAIGPSPSLADDVAGIPMLAVDVAPAVRVFLVAYRGQDPPAAVDLDTRIIAAMEGQSDSTWRFVVVDKGTFRPRKGDQQFAGVLSFFLSFSLSLFLSPR